MSERSWKWFKNGYNWECKAHAVKLHGEPCTPCILVTTEAKDKEEARRLARFELAKYGYYDIDIRKIVPRF